MSQPSSTTQPRRFPLLQPILVGLAFVAVNVICYWLLTREPAQAWLADLGSYSYVGGFLITLLGNATVIVPVPYLAVIMAIATQVEYPLLLIIAGAFGSVLGESVAFFVGRSGRGVVEDTPLYQWIQKQMRHPWRAFLVMFGFAAPPNPAFDVVGLSAGALGLPYWLFFTAVFLGRIIRIGLFVVAALPATSLV